jgi:hypothetical protein
LQDVGSDRHAMDADLVVSLGGDGTVLRAVHLLDGAPNPGRQCRNTRLSHRTRSHRFHSFNANLVRWRDRY